LVGSETDFPHQTASRVGAAVRCKFQFIAQFAVGSETKLPHQVGTRVTAPRRRRQSETPARQRSRTGVCVV